MKPVQNPAHRFSRQSIEWLDVPPPTKLTVFEEQSKSIITRNDSPDIGFEYSVNPYRGCFHACAYCYARPTHQYLEFGAGTDFESKIIVKANAPELLRKELARPKMRGKKLVFSGITDCYQPLELTYELTRQCLEVCAEFGTGVSLITKGALITRDIDILKRIQERASLSVYMSIAFIDDEMSKLIEPGAPRPSRRLRALEELTQAGIPVGIGIAPIIPGLTETQMPQLLEAARARGATRAFINMLRLPAEVREVFFSRLHEAIPERAKKVENSIRSMREGSLNSSTFGHRMKGEGPRWEAIEWLFRSTCERLGLNKRSENDNWETSLVTSKPRAKKPTPHIAAQQLKLF